MRRHLRAIDLVAMTRSRSPLAWLVAVVALGFVYALFTAPPAAAHDAPTRGYSRITAEGDTLTWTLYFDPHYLDTFMHLDRDGDGTVSAGEVDARHGDLANLVLPDISVVDRKT